MRMPKPNITKEDVLKTFYTLDGKSVYLLNEYIPPMAEPEIVMREFGTEDVIKKPLSYFKDFIRLKPEKEIATPRKPRADVGSKHKKKRLSTEGRGVYLEGDSVCIDYVEIHTPKPGVENQDHTVSYGVHRVASPNLAKAVNDLFLLLGISDAVTYIKTQPDSENQTILLNALGVD